MVAGEREIRVGSLLAALPEQLGDESLEEIARGPGVRIERIVSHGHCSPPDFWYDQEGAEWVVVMSGRARLRFAGLTATVELGPGDYVEIPAGARHRVEWTTAEEPTVWLAVHFRQP